jgi:thioredoxin reductase (NADPH)
MPPDDPTNDETAFPTLSGEQLERLSHYGTTVDLGERELVYEEGQATYDFVVILGGAVAVVRRDHDLGQEVLIARHTAGRFLGELNLLTGERTVYAARSDASGTRVIRITPDRFREMMASEADVSDTVFAALVARRELLRQGEGAKAIRILGSRFEPRARELEAFALRRRVPHVWVDLDDPGTGDVDVLLASVGVRPADTPVVITPTSVLRRPTVGELAENLGVTYHRAPGRVRDLVVIGAGPAGLAAGVYGASEGLDTLVLDAAGIGGQAGASSRIENYFGFPTGLSGGELTQAGMLQALRLGATINAPCAVISTEVEDEHFSLTLTGGETLAARAVVVACGVRYRRLALARLEEFEGNGVYYAATDMEARGCEGTEVVVVGGGNSAGQAAVFLAQKGARVTIAIRGESLEATMSKYLINRIVANPAIQLRTRTEVTALHGTGRVESVDLTTNSADPVVETRPITSVFSFIGAEADTSWLCSTISRDADGFLLTDRDVEGSGATVLPFETSQPGVFAVGDVRHGSMKRVAAAVGEGSSAVRSVHQRLAMGV